MAVPCRTWWRPFAAPGQATSLLAVDASFVVDVCLSQAGFAPLDPEELVAPPLLLSEATSAIHELRWRGVVADEVAEMGLERLLAGAVATRRPAQLWRTAWRVADELGWAKTYDAEYVAIALLLRVPLVTVDARLRRGASSMVEVLGPTEL